MEPQLKSPKTLGEIIKPSHAGFIGIVDDLLESCRFHALKLDWHEGRLRAERPDENTVELFELPRGVSLFRTMLARFSAVCNEARPGSVSPYGGEGKVWLGGDPPVILRVVFVNTRSEQRAELTPLTLDPPAADAIRPAPQAAPPGRPVPDYELVLTDDHSARPARQRAWVIVKSTRRKSIHQAGPEHSRLVRQYPEVFAKCLSLYRVDDFSLTPGWRGLVVVEADSLSQVHRAVSLIQEHGKGSSFSTVTYLAVDPVFDNARLYDAPDDQLLCIGFITEPGKQSGVRNRLEAINGFVVADVVFGEFDVISLFRRDRGHLEVLRDAIRSVQSIRKTTTMLPHVMDKV